MTKHPPPTAGRLRALLGSAATGLGLKLGLASALLVSAAIAAAAVFAYQGEREQLLGAMSTAAETQARLVLTGLTFAMLENNPSLVTDLLDQYVQGAGVERIFLFDATGRVGFAAGDQAPGARADIEAFLGASSGLIQPGVRTHAATTEQAGRPVLRALTPVVNEAPCHRCHPANQELLGVLAVDFSMSPVEQARTAAIRRTLGWSAALFALVLLGVGAVVQLGALQRLRRLQEATDSLSPRTPPRSPPWNRDEISELATNIQAVSAMLEDSVTAVGEQREFLRNLLDRIEDGVVVFDRSLRAVATNRAYREGVSRQHLDPEQVELSCRELAMCTGGDREHADCPTRLALQTGVLQRRIHELDCATGTRCFEVIASPVVGGQGKVEHVMELWRDVTDRVAVEANLAHSEQLAAVGILASGFSHEVATPLGTISNSIQGILRRLRGRRTLDEGEIELLRERLDVASGEVFRCRDILRKLLDLSRRSRTAKGPVDVNGVLGHVREVVRPTAEHQGVTIDCRLTPGLPEVSGHAQDLERLVLNLFVNAIEAMPEGGRLTVDSGRTERGVELRVSDSGLGIAPGDLPRVFEPFFSAKEGGTGLGLYLCRQIVQAHGGSIEAASPNRRGATFRVELPSVENSSPAARVEAGGGS